jgi:sugar phosphate isomerase/epimerase
MTSNRRSFIKRATCGLGVAGWLAPSMVSQAADNQPASVLTGKPRMKIGLVTYDLAKDWTIDTIIKNCEAAQFSGVELRTTHAHGVEISLSAAQRAEVKKRFKDSRVELMGLGSIFDYHTPDQAKLSRDIEASKAYIQLAADVGAGGIKVRPNGLPKEVPKEKTLEQIGRSLRELGEVGAGLGVVIRLEVHGSETSLVPNIKKILDFADHKNVGACWNSNDSDLAGEGFDRNFDLIKDKINAVHMRDLFLENYPFRKLLQRLNQAGYTGYCLAEIPPSADPIRVMKYYRALWLAYQNLL